VSGGSCKIDVGGDVRVSSGVGLMGSSRNAMFATSNSLTNWASGNLALGTGNSTTGDNGERTIETGSSLNGSGGNIRLNIGSITDGMAGSDLFR